MIKKICVIDDHPLMREALSLHLSDVGYEVIEAQTGEEGLEAVARGRPDLVVADLRLPGLSGGALLAELRARFPTLPIVAMSGEPSEEHAGADAFLAKPFKPHALEEAIASARRRAGQGGREARR